MKKATTLLLTLLAMVLSGCATQSAIDSQPEADLQAKYRSAINYEARSRATTVIWVKTPSSEAIENRLSRPHHSTEDTQP